MSYLPAESDTGMFGGNSNWRGPIWFPVNALLIRALLNLLRLLRRRLHRRVPDRVRAADDAVPGRRGDRRPADRASSCRTPTAAARSTAGTEKFQDDPHWRDLLLFHEYFHGDNGAGIGASHQTGWTGLVALSATLLHGMTAEEVRDDGLEAAFRSRSKEEPGDG